MGYLRAYLFLYAIGSLTWAFGLAIGFLDALGSWDDSDEALFFAIIGIACGACSLWLYPG